MAIDLSMRRIDAVGYTSSSIHIIEITQVAGLKALGQLTAYPTLFALKYPTNLPIIALLVAERFESDAEEPFRRSGIPFRLLP
ncbi:MAG: hypothetical protein WAO71_05325 [Gallionella sp.]